MYCFLHLQSNYFKCKNKDKSPHVIKCQHYCSQKKFQKFYHTNNFSQYVTQKKDPHHDFLFTPSFYEFYIVSIFWNSFTSHSSRNTLSYLRYSKSSMVPSSPVSLYQLGFALVCVVSFPFCVLL